MSDKHSVAIDPREVQGKVGTTYPRPFREEFAARTKRALGDLFGLKNFGVNLVDLEPGSWSSQRHWHTHEDEFVYVVSGELTLVTDEGEQSLTPGMVVGFPAGRADGHHLLNKSDSVATYLEIGDRIPEDECYYPDIDMQLVSDGKGGRVFTHRDGRPYEKD